MAEVSAQPSAVELGPVAAVVSTAMSGVAAGNVPPASHEDADTQRREKSPARGPFGRVSCRPARSIVFDLPELAALVSSLAALGPTATESAESAMRKLVSALAGDPTTLGAW